jgi:diguanylate cyclase (GGDEF)-like protein
VIAFARHRRWPRVLAAVAVLLSLAAYANLALHERAQRQLATSSWLSELDLRLHEESNLQWRVLADRNAPVRVAREVGTIRARETTLLALIDQALEPQQAADLRSKILAYHDVLDRELNLLGVGKTEEALSLETQQTDPHFERLSATVSELAAEARGTARNATTFANSALLLAVVLATAMIGRLLFGFERALLAVAEAGRQLLAQQERALAQSRLSAEAIKRQAMHDPLTDLPNRLLFAERVDAAGSRRTMLLIDLDDFKHVNDTFGHAAGDQLLITVAERLRAALGEGDTAARLGGDEFAVLLPDAHRDTAVAVAERLLDALSVPFTYAGHWIQPKASIGVAVGTDDIDPEQLLHQADLAMYHAKGCGKNSYTVYGTETDSAEALQDGSRTP